jgi:hypothetical protein
MSELFVSKAEKDKLGYALRALANVKRMNEQFQDVRKSTSLTDGFVVERDVDWIAVSQYCRPHVLLVMVKHATRDASFYPYPKFALLQDSIQVVDLDEEHDLNVIANTASDGGVVAHFDAIESQIQGIDVAKKENAMRNLRALKRILGVKN